MMLRQFILRKIYYLAPIALLLLPLFWLSQPATIGSKGSKGSPGGKLAQLRVSCGLSQTQLGEIDPTSETIELATFGMRGVAANLLWGKANRYKMKKDWTNLSATLQQLSKLEPHFITVWEHQGWNLSYNVSAEFDDYRERFRWVIKGIDFLKEGIRHNEREPRLYWDVGWFNAQKIGRADEHRQFRRLYKDPDNVYGIHGDRPLDERDNWLVGKEWFRRAEKIVDEGGTLRGKSPLIFYSDAPMAQMNYGEALEKDGIFEEKARRAWVRASQDWHDFGAREIPTSYGVPIRLNDGEVYQKKAAQLREKLENLEPGLREKLVQQKRQALPEDMRTALDTSLEQRTQDQHRLAYEAQDKLKVSHDEVARRLKGAKRREGLKIAKELGDADETIRIIDRYREIVNFVFWRRRAQMEQTDEALTARECTYEGDQAYAKGDLGAARAAYDQGLAAWRKLLDRPEFASLKTDRTMVEDLNESIDTYRRILEKRDEEFPKDFILQDIVDQAPKE